MGILVVKRRQSKSPQIGDLINRIVIKSRNIGAPDYDSTSPNQDLQIIATVWASLNTKNEKGVKVFDEVAEKKSATHQFIIRYRTDIVSENIILHKGLNYEILFVDNTDLRNRFSYIDCVLLGASDVATNE